MRRRQSRHVTEGVGRSPLADSPLHGPKLHAHISAPLPSEDRTKQTETQPLVKSSFMTGSLDNMTQHLR